MEIMGALLTAEGRDDPYRLYEQAHRHGAVIDAAEGFVMVTSYEACNQLLRNQAFGVWDAEWRARVWDAEQRARPSVRSMERSSCIPTRRTTRECAP